MMIIVVMINLSLIVTSKKYDSKISKTLGICVFLIFELYFFDITMRERLIITTIIIIMSLKTALQTIQVQVDRFL